MWARLKIDEIGVIADAAIFHRCTCGAQSRPTPITLTIWQCWQRTTSCAVAGTQTPYKRIKLQWIPGINPSFRRRAAYPSFPAVAHLYFPDAPSGSGAKCTRTNVNLITLSQGVVYIIHKFRFVSLRMLFCISKHARLLYILEDPKVTHFCKSNWLIFYRKLYYFTHNLQKMIFKCKTWLNGKLCEP